MKKKFVKVEIALICFCQAYKDPLCVNVDNKIVDSCCYILFSKKGEELTDKHLNPLKVLQTLEDVAGDEALFVADGGDFVGTAAYILR